MYDLLCLANHTSTLNPFLLYPCLYISFSHLFNCQTKQFRLLSFFPASILECLFSFHTASSPHLSSTLLNCPPPQQSAHVVFVCPSICHAVFISCSSFAQCKVKKNMSDHTDTIFTVQTAPASFAGANTHRATAHIDL